jgi:ABC-type sugar transport system permease subunit
MSDKTFAFFLLLPTLLLFAALIFYPLFFCVYLSVTDMNIANSGGANSFVGFKNFAAVFSDKQFLSSLKCTGYFVVFNVVFGIIIGFLFAYVLNKRFKFRKTLRGLMIIPWAVPAVVNGLLWQWIYNANYGVLNGMLRQSGIIKQNVAWLSDPGLAMNMVIFADLWSVIPFICLMYLAAMQSIPADLYEAGIVDGTNGLQTLRYITIPLLMPTTLILLVMRTIATIKAFDILYTLTNGGPAGSTEVAGLYIYKQGFLYANFGTSSAASIVLILISLILVLLYFKILNADMTA